MGCVLGTPAGDGDQRRHRKDQRNGNGSSEVVNNVVTVREKHRNRHTGDFPGTLPAIERRKPILDPLALNQQGWPSWLMAVAGEAIGDWTPRRANTFEKLSKIGQGTYSNVYKARDLVTGKIVALKKVRFDNLEPESVKFMAREILVLRKLDHPNVLKLEGLVTSRMSCSLYLVFEYMVHDLAGLSASQGVKFTEPQVEQLHKIFKLCGSPAEEYWRKHKLPNATIFKPQQPYKRCISETFKDFPPSSLPLIETLLAIDPDRRGTASAALNHEFFTTEPYASEPSSLPKYPPSKELDVKMRDEEARRQKALNGKSNGVDGTKRARARDRSRAIPAPEANAENQTNLDRWRVVTHANAKSKSEKFPPPHQDGAVGYPQDESNKGPASFGAPDTSFNSGIFNIKPSDPTRSQDGTGTHKGTKTKKEESQMPSSSSSSWKFMRPFKPSTIGHSMDLLFRSK
ncbi:unnamed protein product [Trifolium pratense]|uniref:Uncharacterized protein n=1 Tax=Trifolium pratense TaxID=57577 RepID=A0ACB0JB99_TRIPR|nr:unnamed protein product [Trifolium pratense]